MENIARKDNVLLRSNWTAVPVCLNCTVTSLRYEPQFRHKFYLTVKSPV